MPARDSFGRFVSQQSAGQVGNQQADAIAAELEALVEKATVALILEINANLIEATPVDTGWARANWIPSIGEPTLATDAEPARNAKASASNALQSQATAAVLAFKLADGSCFVSNNVPYIRFLDLGRSDQAPAGFVAIAVDKAVDEISSRYLGGER